MWWLSSSRSAESLPFVRLTSRHVPLLQSEISRVDPQSLTRSRPGERARDVGRAAEEKSWLVQGHTSPYIAKYPGDWWLRLGTIKEGNLTNGRKRKVKQALVRYFRAPFPPRNAKTPERTWKKKNTSVLIEKRAFRKKRSTSKTQGRTNEHSHQACQIHTMEPIGVPSSAPLEWVER